MSWVLRVRCSKNGTKATETIGWACKDGSCTSNPRDAARFEHQAEAWDLGIAARLIGEDEDGPWAWAEEEHSQHLLGLSCPDKPENIMGTAHSVTWFPQMVTCARCRVEWDRLCELGLARTNADGRAVLD